MTYLQPLKTIINQHESITFLHGFGFDSCIWEPFLPHVDHENIHLVDLPGFGFHVGHADLSPDKIIDYLARKIQEKTCLIGWSLGASLAIQIAEKHPEKVSKLVLLCCNPKFIAADPWPGVNETTFMHLKNLFLKNPQVGLQRFLNIACLNLPKKLSDSIKLLASKTKLNPNMLITYLNYLYETDLRETISSLALPITWVYGLDDPLVDNNVVVLMQKQLKQKNIINLPGGHFPFIDVNRYE